MEGLGGANNYIEGEEIRVVLVSPTQCRIADWKGGIKDWALGALARAHEEPEGLPGVILESVNGHRNADEIMGGVNGLS